MKSLNEVKPSKYNYVVVMVKKDGTFLQYGNGSVKLENAQKNANSWNKNFNYESYPEVDYFDIATINKIN
jgi:hypothetical protein